MKAPMKMIRKVFIFCISSPQSLWDSTKKLGVLCPSFWFELFLFKDSLFYDFLVFRNELRKPDSSTLYSKRAYKRQLPPLTTLNKCTNYVGTFVKLGNTQELPSFDTLYFLSISCPPNSLRSAATTFPDIVSFSNER